MGKKLQRHFFFGSADVITLLTRDRRPCSLAHPPRLANLPGLLPSMLYSEREESCSPENPRGRRVTPCHWASSTSVSCVVGIPRSNHVAPMAASVIPRRDAVTNPSVRNFEGWSCDVTGREGESEGGGLAFRVGPYSHSMDNTHLTVSVVVAPRLGYTV